MNCVTMRQYTKTEKENKAIYAVTYAQCKAKYKWLELITGNSWQYLIVILQ